MTCTKRCASVVHLWAQEMADALHSSSETGMYPRVVLGSQTSLMVLYVHRKHEEWDRE